MPETEFEKTVRRALLDANRMDWAGVLDSSEDVEPDFSSRYLRRRLKLLNAPFSYARRAARPVWKRGLRTAVCILLAFALSFGMLAATVPSVRAWVQQMVVQWLDDHTRFQFDTGTDIDLLGDRGVWRPSWLPEGAQLVKEEFMSLMTAITYQEADGTHFYFDYTMATNNSSFNVDNEHQNYSEIVMNGHMAYLMEANEAGYMSYLIWMEDETNIAFCITAELSGEEMIKIAESVARIEG